jgi:hypothetical protein
MINQIFKFSNKKIFIYLFNKNSGQISYESDSYLLQLEVHQSDFLKNRRMRSFSTIDCKSLWIPVGIGCAGFKIYFRNKKWVRCD